MGVIVMAVTLAMIYKKTPSCKGDFLQDGGGDD